MQQAGDDFLAGAVLAGDQDRRIRRRDAFDRLAHRFHRRRFGDERRQVAPLQARVFFLQAPAAPQRAAQLELRLHRRDQLVVVPRLLDVVARAAPHRLHGARDAAPAGHHQHRQRRIDRLHPVEQLEPFLPGCRVTRVVEIDQRDVEVRPLELVDELGRRRSGGDLIPLAAQQELEGIEDVDLIVGDEHAAQGDGH